MTSAVIVSTARTPWPRVSREPSTAGNASQFSDGGGACVLMSEMVAERKGLTPPGRILGFAVAGCESARMTWPL
ncbi:MAG: acetyl-CoA C-acyltransferase family protein [Rhodoferax sp.]|nr:acetyl-CoA C-acyltransferase family protein [Rhodoferax sp.]